jgi:hypothetical protein
MPIIKEIKTPGEIRLALLKYPGRVSEAVVASAVKQYEQLQQKYDITEPVPTEEDVIAEVAKDYEKSKSFDEKDAIPFYQTNFNIFVADARKKWPGKYDGAKGEDNLQKVLATKRPAGIAILKRLYVDCRRDETLGAGEYDAQEERKLIAAADFFKWAGLHPTKQEFEHVAELCRGTPFYGGISDLTDYSDTLLDYRKRNDGILNELSMQFVLDESDIKRLSELADKEKEKLKQHEQRFMREKHRPVFGNEPEIQEHYNRMIEKMYVRARNMHNAKIEKSYLHAIESMALQTDIRKKLIYDVVSMQDKDKQQTVISEYIGSFGKTREPSVSEPKPITRLVKMNAYRKPHTDDNAPETRKTLIEGISEDANVRKDCIENLLKRLEPLASDEYERIGYEYYLLKDMNHQTGHAIIKQSIDRLAHQRRETRFAQNVTHAIETAQIFA